MTVVVDLGCYPLGHSSVEILVEQFRPDALYGFDPNPSMAEYENTVLDDCAVCLTRWAAWIYNGTIELHHAGTTRATVIKQRRNARSTTVACFDFSDWLADRRAVWGDQGIVVKMDVEGAEYALLEALILDHHDVLIEKLLVEWHEDWPESERRRDRILGAWAGGGIEEWPW